MSAIICCIMFMIIEPLLGVGEMAGRYGIGGPCVVLGGVCIMGCIVRGMLSVLMMTGEGDESSVVKSSQYASGIQFGFC
jgi:hypothetical protein